MESLRFERTRKKSFVYINGHLHICLLYPSWKRPQGATMASPSLSLTHIQAAGVSELEAS